MSWPAVWRRCSCRKHSLEIRFRLITNLKDLLLDRSHVMPNESASFVRPSCSHFQRMSGQIHRCPTNSSVTLTARARATRSLAIFKLAAPPAFKEEYLNDCTCVSYVKSKYSLYRRYDSYDSNERSTFVRSDPKIMVTALRTASMVTQCKDPARRQIWYCTVVDAFLFQSVWTLPSWTDSAIKHILERRVIKPWVRNKHAKSPKQNQSTKTEASYKPILDPRLTLSFHQTQMP